MSIIESSIVTSFGAEKRLADIGLPEGVAEERRALVLVPEAEVAVDYRGSEAATVALNHALETEPAVPEQRRTPLYAVRSLLQAAEIDATSGHKPWHPDYQAPDDQHYYPELRVTPESYFYSDKEHGFDVQVELVDSTDPRINAAIEMEIAAMKDCGDEPKEVWEEFLEYYYSSMYFIATDYESGEMVGMGRMIPGSEKDGNKSLLDLAAIPDWGEDNHAYPKGWDHELTSHDPVVIKQGFKDDSGCEDLDKTLDVATMAPDVDLKKNNKPKNMFVAAALSATFAQVAVKMWQRGELTHVTSFNEAKHAHRFFLHLGYDFKDLFTLKPMKYNSFATGADSMVAQPAWMAMDSVIEALRKGEHPHMRMVADQLAAAGISLEKMPQNA